MDISGELKNYKMVKCRPLNEKGFNILHQILSQLSWNYTKDENLGANEAFQIFHENFVDSCMIAFPEREVRVSEHGTDSTWYTQELREMREQLELVNDLYNTYKTDNLKTIRNKLKINYKREI